MNLWFIVSLIKKRNDVADVAWGLGFVVLAWASFITTSSNSLISLITNCLVTIWGLRLAFHIYSRNKGKAEDYRYNKWRQDWGKWFYLRSYFQIYILQGIFLFLISLPVLFINNLPSSINIFSFVGFIVWLIGFYFEVVGDYQLSEFIKNPNNKGKLMTSGLWQYTRHPNYFGEVTQWWSIFIIALSVHNGWISIIGPITITFLILKVSGIPMLEKKMEKNPEFLDYKNKTSMFIPLPKRK
jgi:steroid 5-alpha reductase family enzyme